jgi:hypothetical protein
LHVPSAALAGAASLIVYLAGRLHGLLRRTQLVAQPSRLPIPLPRIPGDALAPY